jgi:hypothetical protein
MSENTFPSHSHGPNCQPAPTCREPSFAVQRTDAAPTMEAMVSLSLVSLTARTMLPPGHGVALRCRGAWGLSRR